MEIVTVDDAGLPSASLRALPAERLARKLRALRVERGLQQADVAARVGLSLSTLQAIESNWHAVRAKNLERLAAFYGTSVQRLLDDEGQALIATFNADLLKGLHDEHLQIAHTYAFARRDVRTAVETMLQSGSDADARLYLRVMKLSADIRLWLQQFLTTVEVEQALQLLKKIQQSAMPFSLIAEMIDAQESDVGEARQPRTAAKGRKRKQR